MPVAKYSGDHPRIRKEALANLRPGTLCVRCRHPMWYPADQVDLDHAENGGYLGFSHHSPCRDCGQRCNQAAGGVKSGALRRARAALKAKPGSRSRGRRW